MPAEKIDCPGMCDKGYLLKDPVVPEFETCQVCWGRGYFVTIEATTPPAITDPEAKKKFYQAAFAVK